jgi:hypothetical protein
MSALSWAEANQRHLSAALDDVRRALERHAGIEAAPSRNVAAAPAAHPDGPFALETLAAGFGLSPFERSVVVLCAAVELDGSFAGLCAAAAGNPARSFPSFGLALAALPDAHWSALNPAHALRAWRLVEPASGELLTRAALRLDERVLHFIAGVSHLDDRLQGWVEPVAAADEMLPSQADVARRIEGVLCAPSPQARPIIQLAGGAPGEGRSLAAATCSRLGLELYSVRAADLPAGQAERETLTRLWGREVILASAALLVEAEESDAAERARVAAIADRLPGVVLVATREPLPPTRRAAVRLEARRPTATEQRALWARHLGPLAGELNGHLDLLVAHFNLGETAITAACAEAAGAGGEGAAARLWDACRAQARPRLEDLAQRVEPAADWVDLVLPPPQKELLREIATQVRHRTRVYEDWGFARMGQRGLGISALFAGLSGTGKTMAAEVLARELRLDVYRIDLSQVVSKYIGETEKNLRRVFDAAEGGGAILLFDEADALFGKRSEVKDSHDRYANIEVSYLLQRMESYGGLAILTTNLKNTLDPAFLRRLRFVVTFPFPDAGQREAIWRGIFPVSTPTEGLDHARLARLNVAGGNIRNIALQAAFLAAEAGEPVRMRHLLRAARTECLKLDRTLTEAEVAGWA